MRRSEKAGRALARVIALALATGVAASASAYDLQRHLWRDRVLVLATPDADDPALRRQLAEIDTRRDAVIDRDLRVLTLAGARGDMDGQPLKAGEADRLRRELAVAADERVLILLGLDGGEKRRAPLGSALRSLFLQIDAMPMRRADIREKKAAGIEVTEP